MSAEKKRLFSEWCLKLERLIQVEYSANFNCVSVSIWKNCIIAKCSSPYLAKDIFRFSREIFGKNSFGIRIYVKNGELFDSIVPTLAFGLTEWD